MKQKSIIYTQVRIRKRYEFDTLHRYVQYELSKKNHRNYKRTVPDDLPEPEVSNALSAPLDPLCVSKRTPKKKKKKENLDENIPLKFARIPSWLYSDFREVRSPGDKTETGKADRPRSPSVLERFVGALLLSELVVIPTRVGS